MIKNIAHLADIHLRKIPTRNDEYLSVFNNTINTLQQDKPDRIVIVGDIVNDYLSLGTEQLILGRYFLRELSKIAKVVIIRGNHDCLITNNKRKDSIEAIMDGMGTENVVYYNETGFYEDDNVVWVVWHHENGTKSPWKTREGKKHLKQPIQDKKYIDLYHDPVYGVKMVSGIKKKDNTLFKPSDFKGDYGFLGDIHLMQYLNKDKTQAYCGSLIAQNFSEGDDNFHGYLLWDIVNQSTKERNIHNDEHAFINIIITTFTDFDDLDYDINANTKNVSLRFVWETLPAARNKKNERNLQTYFKSKYPNINFKFFNKNAFVEDDEIDTQNTKQLRNIMNPEVQQEIFKDFLEKIGTKKDVIDKIGLLDKKITSSLPNTENVGYEWDVLMFGGENFMSYDKFDVDWRDKEGLYQIKGKNTAGKTTLLFKFLPYMFYGKTLETKKRIKNGDLRYINNRKNVDYCNGYVKLDINGEYYGIYKTTKAKKNKDGEFTDVSSSTSYHRLSSPDEIMSSDNNIESLDENKKNKVQNLINNVVGTYDNFMRVVLTTSDTLNDVLSSDMSEFLDSLMHDSGLDIFEQKSTQVKKLEKKINDKGRVSCNVNEKTDKIKTHQEEIKNLKDQKKHIEDIVIKDLNKKIEFEEDKISDFSKELYKIDQEIYNLNIKDEENNLNSHKKTINNNNEKIESLIENNKLLCDSFDEEYFSALEKEKEVHRGEEYDKKIKIKDTNYEISLLQNEIDNLKRDINHDKERGSEKKEKYLKIKNLKTCDRCGGPLSKEQLLTQQNEVTELKKEIYKIKETIEIKQNKIIELEKTIQEKESSNEELQQIIDKNNERMEKVLSEIGDLTNQKNDFYKRKENEQEINNLKFENKNTELTIGIIEDKIRRYYNQLDQIEKNKNIEEKIKNKRETINTFGKEKEEYQNEVNNINLNINNLDNKIKEIENLINEFKEQEKRDEVFSLYKKCVHRDGLPRQILINHVIPKLNKTMDKILEEAPINMWLDENTLRPQFNYKDKPDAIIDCISASGQERTYSSIVLKFSLNQINVKSRPKLFMLDEVMGKLDIERTTEFVEILHEIKKYINRVIVVEHRSEVYPDYTLNVELNENRLSEVNLY